MTPQEADDVGVRGAAATSVADSPRNGSVALRKSKAQRRFEREMRQSAQNNDSENEPEEAQGAAKKRNQLENVRKFMQQTNEDSGGENEIQIFEPKRRRPDDEGRSAVLSRDASNNRNDLRLGDLQDTKSATNRRRSQTFVDEDEEP